MKEGTIMYHDRHKGTKLEVWLTGDLEAAYETWLDLSDQLSEGWNTSDLLREGLRKILTEKFGLGDIQIDGGSRPYHRKAAHKGFDIDGKSYIVSIKEVK
jgi:hypothetical protein